MPNLETQQVSVLDELTKVLSNLELKENTNLILGGDFNLILNLKLDADGGNPTLKSNSMKSLNILTMENDLVDIWIIRNPESNRGGKNSYDAKKAWLLFHIRQFPSLCT